MFSWGGRGSFYSYIDLAMLLTFDYFMITKYGLDGVLNIFSSSLVPKEFIVIHLLIFAFTPVEALILFIEDKNDERHNKIKNLGDKQ